MSPRVRRHLPNTLTVARLALAAGFFVLLEYYVHPIGSPVLLDAAVVVFALASITDTLDGMLARRWAVTSTFGRIMDPLCDKVLVIGAFAYLAGPAFTVIQGDGAREHASGVYPWMVVVILTRELLVTSLRGLAEAQNVQFGAQMPGKLKMALQSLAIPTVLLLVAHADPLEHLWSAVVRDVFMYATLVATVVSGLPYIWAARLALAETPLRADG